MMIELTQQVHRELNWWVRNIKTAERRINHGHPSAKLRTDASMSGWGAVLNGVSTGGRWTLAETAEHINVLELQAALFGLKSLCDNMCKCHLRIEVDNSTAVCYINSMGGTVSKKCNKLAREIWNWCTDRQIWLSACHIAGVKNIEADKASRVFNDRTEWRLDPKAFQDANEALKVNPNIDLFATRLNRQLSQYVSWQPDPEAAHIDAFTLNWAETDNYLFPPFSLINRCVQKLTFDQARALIVVPVWPNQCWFTPLMRLLVDHPRVLPVNCLSLPEGTHAKPPPKVRLIACHISGRNCEIRAFQKGLPTLSWHLGKQTLKSSTTQSLVNGMPFAVGNKWITLKRLYR